MFFVFQSRRSLRRIVSRLRSSLCIRLCSGVIFCLRICPRSGIGSRLCICLRSGIGSRLRICPRSCLHICFCSGIGARLRICPRSGIGSRLRIRACSAFRCRAGSIPVNDIFLTGEIAERADAEFLKRDIRLIGRIVRQINRPLPSGQLGKYIRECGELLIHIIILTEINPHIAVEKGEIIVGIKIDPINIELVFFEQLCREYR